MLGQQGRALIYASSISGLDIDQQFEFRMKSIVLRSFEGHMLSAINARQLILQAPEGFVECDLVGLEYCLREPASALKVI